MTPEEFRRLGHEIIDWIADYRETLHERPVAAPVVPGQIRSTFAEHPPEAPQGLDGILSELDQVILPGLVHWQHPRFCGYFPANAPYPAILADLVSTGLGTMGLSWQAAPALTEVEDVTLDWMRQMLGLSPAWQGVIQDTASTSSLVALICARERTTQLSMTGGGLQACDRPLTVYVSTQSHSSVDKAARLAGFGQGNVRAVEHDDHYAMNPDALARLIQADRREGRIPCAVVATTGTTSSTAMDPIDRIASLARQHGLWLHVDAAMAGSAMILPECRNLWQSIEEADSLVLNPHKWLGAAFDCSLYYVRDVELLTRVMSTNPAYLRTSADGQVKNYRDWGIPLGRRFRALKLWWLIRSEGVQGLQSRLRRDLSIAQTLKSLVEATPHWRVVAPVPLQTVCIRHEPPGLTGEALEAHTQAWIDGVNRAGQTYLTGTKLSDQWIARVSLGATTMTLDDLHIIWSAIRTAAESLARPTSAP